MKGIKTFGLILISIILIFSGFAYQTCIGAQNTVLSPGYYRDIIKETDLAANIHAGLCETMPEMMLQGMQQDMESAETEDVPEQIKERLSLIAGVLGRAFDPQWLEEQILLVIDDVLALFKGERDEFAAVIDLREGKERMAAYLVEDLKELMPKQLEEMEIQPDMIEPVAQQILLEMDIPDRIHLNELIEDEGVPPEMEEIMTRGHLLRSSSTAVLYIVFALLLLLCCLLAGIFGGLKWFGASSAISGAAFFTGLMLLRHTFVNRFEAGLHGEMPVNPEIVVNAFNYTIDRITVIPVITIITGILIFAGGFLIPIIRAKQKVKAES
jgi:hypothetical protein